jgi:hypothetical protein
MDQYPTIKFIVERGDRLAVGIGVLPLIGAVVLAGLGVHWLILPGGSRRRWSIC